ncbi:DUF4365 domain-containing protein [Halorubrum ezzemoulense]|uniref:DUF4365 domain-containing protein n=1 Tax=Halorubrum ezzemoulense TaxID=337243 RepID=UPI0023302AC1|nr:DUF4365 domain-containing protein [Halorubrum ezzemoulense]MDB9301255.1 DUF4365 domain-containing protein [Halorubrum ezzemoulense]
MTEKPSDETSPAAYPDTDEEEQETIRILEDCFPSRVKSHIDSRDKVPNHDGHVEIVDSSGSPQGRIVVQVKKLPDGQADPPKKQIKTKHLAYCRSVIDPFVLILVDVKNEVGYWKHITESWFEQEELDSQGSKVVRLDGQNRIELGEQKYISDWLQIVRETKKRIDDYDLFEELKERSNPAIGREDDKFRHIHRFLDNYHNLLENDYESLKQQRFPDVWKFGFGSIDYTEDSLRYTLYPIYKSENDAQIREIDFSWEEIQKLGASGARGIPHDNPLQREPEAFAYDVIGDQVEKQIRDRDLDFTDNHFLAMEYVYPFVNKYSELLGLSDQEEYPIEDVREGYYRYLQFWLTEELKGVLQKHEIGEVGTSIQSYLRADTGDRYERMHEIAATRTEEASSDPPRHRIHGPDFDQDLLEKMIDTLVESPLDVLVKPFQGEDLERQELDSIDTVWDLYSNETLFQNAKQYYTNYPAEFRNVISANFPKLESEVDYPPTNFLLVVVDPSEMKKGIGGGWVMRKFWLNSDRDDLRVEIHRPNADELPVKYDDPFEGIQYDGTEYAVERISAGAAMEMGDVIRGNSSLLDEVLDEVKQEITSHLQEKAPVIQHPAR